MHVGRIRLRAGQLVAVPLMDMLLFVAVKRLVLRIVSQIAGKNLIGLITMISLIILVAIDLDDILIVVRCESCCSHGHDHGQCQYNTDNLF